jgi:AT-rich interactive domain-containing protein 1
MLGGDEDSIFKIVNSRNLELMNRCACISTIIRNLSFVPGNDSIICKNHTLLKILSRLLVIKHEHQLIIRNNLQNCSSEFEESDEDDLDLDADDDHDVLRGYFLSQEIDCIKKLKHKNLFYTKKSASTSSSSSNSNEWWWECVHLLRENSLVTIANISTSINLNNMDEEIIELYAHGLIHWCICRSQDAQDPLKTLPDTSLLSPQRLAIESLSKMTIKDINIDLVLATISKMKPYMDSFIGILSTEFLVKREDQTMREFALVLLSSMAKSDQFAARCIAKYTSHFITFLEDFEEQVRVYRLLNPNFHHQMQTQNSSVDCVSNLNEEQLGTTVDMLRRCAQCLLNLSQHTENVHYLKKNEPRLLELTTSNCTDYKVSQTLAECLFYCSSFAY